MPPTVDLTCWLVTGWMIFETTSFWHLPLHVFKPLRIFSTIIRCRRFKYSMTNSDTTVWIHSCNAIVLYQFSLKRTNITEKLYKMGNEWFWLQTTWQDKCKILWKTSDFSKTPRLHSKDVTLAGWQMEWQHQISISSSDKNEVHCTGIQRHKLELSHLMSTDTNTTRI